MTTLDTARAARQLLARIDVALEVGNGTTQESVALAWRSALRDHPALIGVLDGASGTHRTTCAAVAVAAGLATFDTPAATAAAAGAAFLASVDLAPVPARPSWLARTLRRLWDGGPDEPFPWAA